MIHQFNILKIFVKSKHIVSISQPEILDSLKHIEAEPKNHYAYRTYTLPKRKKRYTIHYIIRLTLIQYLQCFYSYTKTLLLDVFVFEKKKLIFHKILNKEFLH